MFNFTDLKQLHLEITNNCQASCPMCGRNCHGLENPNLKLNGWTLSDYKNIITQDVINQVNAIYFCGNYGDPLLSNDLIDMIRYTVEAKPGIDLRVHTNGSLRSKAWWKELAETLPEEHAVIFAIDGLQDTHSIYRIGTSFDKVIENAKAFIDAGGRAKWAYIRFKHNEHQVDEARQMAKDLGFIEFSLKDSSRWLMEPRFPVLNKDQSVNYYLEPSQYSEIKIIDKNVINNHEEILKNTEIDCYAQHMREAYIDCYGNVFPCCWLALIPYQPPDRYTAIKEIRGKIENEYNDLVSSLGGINALNAINRSLQDIINSQEYQTVWEKYWGEKKLITCARTCGKMKELFSTPKDQFVETENL